MIETRGEGGYVLVAPTVGYVRREGCTFDTIVYCTWDEWVRVEAVLRSFDDTQVAAPAPTVATRSTVALDPMLRGFDESPFEAELAKLPPMSTVLAGHGWTATGRRDAYGFHWVRPGKDPRAGSSGSVSDNDRLYVHSSNAGMHVGNPTYDVLDVMLFYELGRDASQADRTEWFKARMGAQRPPAVRNAGAPPAVDEVAALNLSTEPCLADWFWEATTLLTRMRDSAMERGLSPDGVFGSWLSGYATTIPMGIWVAGPPRRAPLNMFCVLVGSSGTGKTGSMGVAEELLGWNVNLNPHVLLGRSLRSGEGLPKLAVIPRKRGEDDDGSPSYRNAIQICFDEGGVLGKQVDRQGSSTIPYLNTAWSGSGTVGGALAREIFEFPANLVRVCAVMGVQYGAAANLFTGEAALLGFPQRLLYFGLAHPALRDADVTNQAAEPAPPLELPFYNHSDYTGRPLYLEFPPDIEHGVRLWTQNKDHGDGIDDPLDAHQMNLTKRTACILALAHGKRAPSEQFWLMASHVYETSRRIRRLLFASLGEASLERRRARISEAVDTAQAVDDRWVRTRAARIARHLHNNPEGNTLKDIKKRLAGDEKPRVHEMLGYATASDWVIHKDDRYFPGGSQPAV